MRTKKEIKNIYKTVLKEGSFRKAAEALGMCNKDVGRIVRAYCKENGLEVPSGKTVKDLEVKFPDHAKVKTRGIQRFIITSAHNNTPLNMNFWKALKVAANHMNAQLCVIPLLYKNPSLFTKVQADAIHWPEEIKPYTIHRRIDINNDWMIAGELHIQATAARPLSSLQGYSQERSCVVGHARVCWESRATPSSKPPVRQITTGSISVPQYSDTKLGQLSRFHHTQAALLIETDGKSTFVRHLRPDAETGRFYDFDNLYSPTGFWCNVPDSVEAFVFGDLHEMFSPELGSILELAARYKPKYCFIHDAIDAFSISHHHEKDPFMKLAKMVIKKGSLRDEIKSLVTFHNLIRTQSKGTQVVYVEPHHSHDNILY